MACPRCGVSCVSDRDQPPWCPACEWNLGAIHLTGRGRGRRRALRLRNRAYAVNATMYEQLRGHRPARPSMTVAGATLFFVSAVLLLADLALLIFGAYLLLVGPWRARALGVFLVLVGVELRPRLPRVGVEHWEVSPETAPSLFQIVDHARASIGAPKVDTVILTDQYNASCGRSGLRQSVVLQIGLPLWISLGDDARLALLGHELGHLVNGDVTRSVLAQPVMTTFARLADVLDP